MKTVERRRISSGFPLMLSRNASLKTSKTLRAPYFLACLPKIVRSLSSVKKVSWPQSANCLRTSASWVASMAFRSANSTPR